MLKAIFFDLDGTLLSLDEEKFKKIYFNELLKKFKEKGFETTNLLNTIIKGTELMYANDGSDTNETVFFRYINSIYKPNEAALIKSIFIDFYNNNFALTKESCKMNKLSKKIVKFAKDNNLLCILSTNPIFPLKANFIRMSFTDLDKNDFDYITSFENTTCSKPNPLYFKKLLDKFNLKNNEVIVFGNHEKEDFICAQKANLKCYLVNNGCVILTNEISNKIKDFNKNIIDIEEVIPTIENEIRSHLK